MPKTKANTKDVASVSHEEATVSMFRKGHELAAEYLNQVLADGTREELLVAMRQLTLAFGGAATTVKMAETRSKGSHPELPTLTQLLKVMGLRLAIEPLPAARPRRRSAIA